jgi:hypothetical protein
MLGKKSKCEKFLRIVAIANLKRDNLTVRRTKLFADGQSAMVANVEIHHGSRCREK